MSVKTDFRDYSCADISQLITYINNPNAAADADLEPTDKLSETDLKTMAVFKQSIDELKESIDNYDPSWWQMIIDLFTLQWCKLYRLNAIIPQVQAAVGANTDLWAMQQDALKLADEIVADNSIETKPYKPRGSELEFTPNEHIAKLISVYNDNTKILFDLIKKTPEGENPWNDQNIIDKAIYGMKLAYQINKESILDDLPIIKAKIRKETPEKIGSDYTPNSLKDLRDTDLPKLENFLLEYEAYCSYGSYLEKTFYFTVDMYYHMRGQIYWGKDPMWAESNPNLKPSFVYDIVKIRDDAEGAAPFYETGTWQNSMRLLFNDYCAFVREHVSMELAPSVFDRHLPWIKPDLAFGDFSPIAGSRST